MTWNVFDWTERPFLILYASLAAVSFAFIWITDRMVRRRDAGAAPHSFAPTELALLAGGPKRCAEVIALQLVQIGRLYIDEGRKRLIIRPDDGDRSLPQVAALRQVGSILEPRQLMRPLLPWITVEWDRLAAYGLVLSRSEALRLRITRVCIIGSLILTGSIKAVVGASREKPIGFLVLMIVATVMLEAMLSQWRGIATSKGRIALGRYERTNQRVLSAPRAHEALFAFAVVGHTALAGTILAGYDKIVKATGDGGCGSGGCGEGGGGCGGCGGD